MFRYLKTLTLVMLTLTLWATVLPAQTLRANLFAETDRVLARADSVQAAVLAPSNYASAMKYYQRAEEKLEKGRNLGEINADLEKAVGHLRLAIQACTLAEVTFPTVLRARTSAMVAEAPRYADEPWQRAGKKFSEAARKLEDGDVTSARSKGSEAEALFRDAELAAIQTNFLDEARRLIGEARRDDVHKYAPTTLAQAEKYLSDAETALTADRYDTDRPRNLARQAKYEAQHAIYLARVIRVAQSRNNHLEELLLASEEPLNQIAGSMDMVPDFTNGYAATTDGIVKRFVAAETMAQNTQQELADCGMQVVDLKAELGGVSSEREQYQQRAEKQEKARQQLATLEGLFGGEEARILRDGQTVIIRLTGMAFAPGKSEIVPADFALLTKVQNAILTYREHGVEVVGHTDSYGSDEANQLLSEQRAEAVRQYLMANTTGLQVSAVGRGESNPIANNETVEGRARNRRIEINLRPLQVADRR